MEDVLKYSLRPFPAPLAKMAGKVEAESHEAYVENVDGDSALIIDAMAVNDESYSNYIWQTCRRLASEDRHDGKFFQFKYIGFRWRQISSAEYKRFGKRKT